MTDKASDTLMDAIILHREGNLGAVLSTKDLAKLDDLIIEVGAIEQASSTLARKLKGFALHALPDQASEEAPPVQEPVAEQQPDSREDQWLSRQELAKHFTIRYGTMASLIDTASESELSRKKRSNSKKAATTYLLEDAEKLVAAHRVSKKSSQATKKAKKPTPTAKKAKKPTAKTSPAQKMSASTKLKNLTWLNSSVRSYLMNNQGVSTVGEAVNLNPEKLWRNARKPVERMVKAIKNS